MPRRTSFANVIVIALCAIATILSFAARPPSRHSARGHETIAPLKARSVDLARLDRRVSIVERGHRVHDGSPPALAPALAFGSPLPSIAPLAELKLRPSTWIAWRAPARARADLMVFLN